MVERLFPASSIRHTPGQESSKGTDSKLLLYLFHSPNLHTDSNLSDKNPKPAHTEESKTLLAVPPKNNTHVNSVYI